MVRFTNLADKFDIINLVKYLNVDQFATSFYKEANPFVKSEQMPRNVIEEVSLTGNQP
jgi:hypothetical protein